jgi:predicted RNA-binding Zn ribbon-like protein
MPETPPTAATMRLDGGHPALDLVNTIYAPPAGHPIDHDVLAAPADLVTFARRVGLAGPSTRADAPALAAARELRDALSAALRRDAVPAGARRTLERAGRDALAAATLRAQGGALHWSWRAADPMTPVHRLARAGLELLADDAELARLRRCDACCWLFLDHSRGAGRRWCSMADCGTAVKKRRYVERRRARAAR